MTHSFFPSFFESGKEKRPTVQSLRDQIDRVFEDFGAEKLKIGSSGILSPKIDVGESDKAIEISIELPGVKEEDVDVTVTDDVLVIKGEKSHSHEESDKNFHVVERSYGSFMRSIPLGFHVDESKVNANIKDGVLTIQVTKPAEITKKTKKIAISKAS